MSGSSGTRVRVKICGLTCAADAELAVELGADALGFNTWPGSKRYLDIEAAVPWLRALPPLITRVALCVNASLAEAQALQRLPYLDAVQLHGDEDAGYAATLAQTGPVIRALRIGSEEDLAAVEAYPDAAILLDAKVAGEFGGTGVPVELALAQEFQKRYPARKLILAGGLKPENVARAVEVVQPYAVDVSSGVERVAGKKDAGLLRAFMAAARGR